MISIQVWTFADPNISLDIDLNWDTPTNGDSGDVNKSKPEIVSQAKSPSTEKQPSVKPSSTNPGAALWFMWLSWSIKILILILQASRL